MIIILNYAQTEAILYRHCRMPIEIERLKLEIEEIENNIGAIKGVSYDGMPGAPGSISDPTANEIIQKEKRLAKLHYRLRVQELQKELIDITYNQLDDDLKKVFKAQYVTNCRDSKANIARRLCVSRSKYYKDKDRLVNIFKDALEKYETN